MNDVGARQILEQLDGNVRIGAVASRRIVELARFFFASAIRSRTDFTGNERCTTSTKGAAAINDTGARFDLSKRKQTNQPTNQTGADMILEVAIMKIKLDRI